MVSRKNPNKASKNRLAARAGRVKKQAQMSSAAGRSKVSKQDHARGAGGGLLPTSGPNAALSKKKQKKVDQRLRLALKRKMELEGEVEMTGMFGWLMVAGKVLTGLDRCQGGEDGGGKGGRGDGCGVKGVRHADGEYTDAVARRGNSGGRLKKLLRLRVICQARKAMVTA